MTKWAYTNWKPHEKEEIRQSAQGIKTFGLFPVIITLGNVENRLPLVLNILTNLDDWEREKMEASWAMVHYSFTTKCSSGIRLTTFRAFPDMVLWLPITLLKDANPYRMPIEEFETYIKKNWVMTPKTTS